MIHNSQEPHRVLDLPPITGKYIHSFSMIMSPACHSHLWALQLSVEILWESLWPPGLAEYPSARSKKESGSVWLRWCWPQPLECDPEQLIASIFKHRIIWKKKKTISGVIQSHEHKETQLKSMPHLPRRWVLEIGYMYYLKGLAKDLIWSQSYR